MTRRKRSKNKIEGPLQGTLIKLDTEPLRGSAAAMDRTAFAVTRSTLFTAEFEQVIEIIARDRVYRAMLASLKGRLLSWPPAALLEP
jgi:hypothetical protein